MQTQKAEPGLGELAQFRFEVRRFLSFSEARAKAAGLTAQQYQLLQVVELGGDAGQSISALAERLLLRHNSAVELVDRAERVGLVVRFADTTDLRRSLVRLTPAGREILNTLVEEHLAYLRTAGAEMLKALRPMVC